MSEYSREELLRLLSRCSPRTRRTVLRILEGEVAEDGVAYVREDLSFMEPDHTVRSVELISSRLCSGGHVLDDKTRIVARAQCCGAIVCDAEGCTHVCSRCGKTLCREHTCRVDGKDHCARCRLPALLKIAVFGRKETEE